MSMRLLGDARALLRRHEIERAHVVQAVGELDQQHADVVEMASRSLRRFSACAAFSETRSSRSILVRPSTSAPISAPNSWSISARVASVSSMVSCSSAAGDGGVVELQLGEDGGDFQRVGEIGIARGALLVAMRLHGIDIGAVEQILVRVRVIAA